MDVPHSDEVYMVMFANIFTSDVWEAVLPEAMKNSPKLPLPEEGNLAARVGRVSCSASTGLHSEG